MCSGTYTYPKARSSRRCSALTRLGFGRGGSWIDATRAIDIIHDNRHPLAGLQIWSDRVAGDEIDFVAGTAVTTPVRTALDLACWCTTTTAVAVLDDLVRATELKLSDVELLSARYRGRRGIGRARASLNLVDSGAQSPKETWLRLVLVQAGLPRPQTHIPVYDDFGDTIAYLDMGWEDVKVAVEYDGDQHRNDRRQYIWDIRRLEMAERLGWLVIRVVAGHRPAEIIHRVRSAPRVKPGSTPPR